MIVVSGAFVVGVELEYASENEKQDCDSAEYPCNRDAGGKARCNQKGRTKNIKDN